MSEIISDFEMSENLGIIFPEIFYIILLNYGNMINSKLMHSIEIIWPYLVKLNGYYYKIIFKHF